MSISRRNFLGGVTGCAAALWSFQPIGLDAPGSEPEYGIDCVLLDLKSHCVLRESLQGYQAALNLLPEATLNSQRRYRLAIVPAFGAMESAVAWTLSDLLAAGTHVLLESGAGFLSPAEFTVHQRMLNRHFDIAVCAPVDLWAGKPADDAPLRHRAGRHPGNGPDSYASIPYVNYLWPLETKVRDFSRVIPVSASGASVIGKVGALPVALKRRTARGTLIFLGSPLGPSLRAGDFEALSWLRLVATL
jgi:hypothetical protein